MKITHAKMVKELKEEFNKLYQSKKLDGLINILKKHHPIGRKSQTSTNIWFTCNPLGFKNSDKIPLAGLFVAMDENNNRLIRLTTISRMRLSQFEAEVVMKRISLNNKYVGVGLNWT